MKEKAIAKESSTRNYKEKFAFNKDKLVVITFRQDNHCTIREPTFDEVLKAIDAINDYSELATRLSRAEETCLLAARANVELLKDATETHDKIVKLKTAIKAAINSCRCSGTGLIPHGCDMCATEGENAHCSDTVCEDERCTILRNVLEEINKKTN